jgi:hypothetical protein
MTAPRALPGLLPLAALVVGTCAGAARADHLDDRLNAQAPRIVEALHKQGVKNVGVLRFRVKEGDRPESYAAGPLNGNLAVRLENVLVMHAGADDKDALGVIHDAGREAARNKVGKWHDGEAEQRKLFAIDTYPLAWGSKKVKADAFLTGLVTVSSDYRRGTVVIEELRAPGKAEKLIEFEFQGDPALLADLGKSYSLGKRSLSTARTPTKTRDLVFDAVKKREDGQPTGDDPAVTKDSVEVGGVEFQLLSGDKAVPITSKGTADKAAGYQLESPDAGTRIAFKITNKTDKTLGVDVKLNGTSLFLEQTDEPAACRVWVLKPEDKFRSYTLEGYYYQDGEGTKPKVAPLKVLVGDEAQKAREEMTAQLADRVGTITVTVFEEGTGDPTGSEFLVSARGLKKRDEKLARSDRGTLQQSLMRSGHLKRDPVRRELIVADKQAMKEAEDGLLRSVEFKRQPVPIGSVTITVLPKAAASTGTPQ